MAGCTVTLRPLTHKSALGAGEQAKATGMPFEQWEVQHRAAEQ